jgi:septal ring factor EnvC (AmiA/AmiB activator)
MNTQPTPRTDANVKRHNLCRLSGNDLVYADFPRQLERELTAVTAQRDWLAEEIDKLESHIATVKKCHDWTAADRDAVARQRDRLAETLEQIIEEDGVPMSMRASSPKLLAKQALQSITPNTKL